MVQRRGKKVERARHDETWGIRYSCDRSQSRNGSTRWSRGKYKMSTKFPVDERIDRLDGAAFAGHRTPPSFIHLISQSYPIDHKRARWSR